MTGNGAGHPGVCRVCGSRLKRNGATSAGKTRWRCTNKECNKSLTKSRPDLERRHDLKVFLDWLLDGRRQWKTEAERKAFQRRIAWCWNIKPKFAISGEVDDEIQLDGTYLDDGWCLLTAVNGLGVVVGYQWCDTEKTAAWEALLSRIPAPRVAVIDGGQGLASALNKCWPETKVQRCLVHIQRNVRTYLTTNPRTDAGKELRKISLALTKIKTVDQAIAWQQALDQWYQKHGELLKQRTYAGKDVVRPTWARANSVWWYTHDRLRKAYYVMHRVVKDKTAFIYLDPEFGDMKISWTTNRIEGGCNSQIKELLRRHRGMPSPHQRRTAEWWLYTHSNNPKPAHTLIKPEHWQPKITPKQAKQEPDRPTLEDPGIPTAEEGLWARKGWAGRSN